MSADPPAVEPISDFGAFVDELVRRHVEACDQQPHPDELIGCIDTIGNGLDVRFKALIDARARLQAAEARATQAELLAETRYEDGLDEGDRRTRAEMEARAARAEVALQPFADFADLYAPQEDDAFEVHKDASEVRITLGQLRAARAALTRSAPATGQEEKGNG